VFLLVLAHPGSPGQRAIKRSLLLLMFCIYSITDRVRLNVVLKIEVHRVVEPELEQTNNESTMF